MNIEADCDLYPRLRQEQMCGSVKLDNGIPILCLGQNECIMTMVYKSLQNIH